MITYIKGEVLHYKNSVHYNTVEILTNSGVGYMVLVPTRDGVKLPGQPIELYTYFVVREDQQSLFGFKNREDRELFTTFLSVSGIGPKSALVILSTYDNDELAEILETADFKKLSKVSGIGEKSAKKIILELQGKVEFGTSSDVEAEIIKDLKTALKSLGFKGEDLDKMIESGQKLIKDGVDGIEELIQRVLKGR